MSINLTTQHKDATAQLEDISDYLDDVSTAKTGQFMILVKGPDAVFPDGETPEYFGTSIITDTAGDTYAVDLDKFCESYDFFRTKDGVALYASKALGDQENQTKAFLKFVATSTATHNPAQNSALTMISQLVRGEESLMLPTIRQAGEPDRSREDLGFTAKLAA